MKERFDLAVRLAEQAGDITLKYYRSRFDVEIKPDDSPVTIADRSAEEYIRAEIEKHYPEDAILGEEFGEKEGQSGCRWILDPIDGTKSFIRSVPLYGTMIAVEKEGESRIGVVRFPPLGETVAALAGHGCFLNGERCRVSSTPTLDRASVMTTTLDGFIGKWGSNALLQLIEQTAFQRTWGDCFAYRLLAGGQVDAAFDSEVKIWDVAPLIPIVQEAGGTLTDEKGETSLAIKNVIATNGRIHQAVLDLLTRS